MAANAATIDPVRRAMPFPSSNAGARVIFILDPDYCVLASGVTLGTPPLRLLRRPRLSGGALTPLPGPLGAATLLLLLAALLSAVASGNVTCAMSSDIC